ncbi:ComEA family DNA-binding protein [Arthrobacter sp. ISL-48]|uniref:ComEA family DNA-binding protein n=1 Tax=Arthrobacter sp. ISL-48 TaxID=2819110 RepID=UPI001BE9A6D5|nr:ComEA family DNA-binding protein [Arthrobacter sp. ISL-48]MBT2531420.1 ComEA family DNA-binding protein [Arthrobacter sp. ISL-48]
MSRLDAGTATRHGARHARDRLQATLGDGPRTALLSDRGGEAFQYDGGDQVGGSEGLGGKDRADGNPGPPLPGAGRVGPALRWRLGRRVAVLIGIVAVAAGAWFWWQVSAGRPEVVPLSDVTSSGAPSAAGEPAGPEPADPGQSEGSPGVAAGIVVHVAGAVARPGVVQLPSGSRVHEAVAAAGGSTPTADLNRLNLAAVVLDGQKVYVPLPGEFLPPDSSGASSGASGSGEGLGGSAAAAGGKTNLNTASMEELDALPKVGPVLAQRIVDWRKEHGPFKTVEELDAVDGVGPKMLETLLPLLGV